MSYPASKHSHFDLVPGHQNTTTKEPLLRPPDMRLVTALASKGPTLTSTLREMNLGPSGRETALQQLTTRDVVMIPDLFEPHSGFVMPKDPWENGSKKTIYQRLVEEIHHAGSLEAAQGGGNAHHDKAFSTDKDGLFKDDAGGLFKAWHKTTPLAAGDGLADANGRDGNGHLIVNDRDSRWQQACTTTHYGPTLGLALTPSLITHHSTLTPIRPSSVARRLCTQRSTGASPDPNPDPNH